MTGWYPGGAVEQYTTSWREDHACGGETRTVYTRPHLSCTPEQRAACKLQCGKVFTRGSTNPNYGCNPNIQACFDLILGCADDMMVMRTDDKKCQAIDATGLSWTQISQVSFFDSMLTGCRLIKCSFL